MVVVGKYTDFAPETQSYWAILQKQAETAAGGSVITCPPPLSVLKDTYDHSCY